jgi:Cu+-exporting ATPase
MEQSAPDGQRVELNLRGMHCAGCVATIEGALRRVPGVDRAAVNLATERATVWLRNGEPNTLSALVEAVQRAGYAATSAAAVSAAPGDDARDPARDRERTAQLARLLLAALLGLPVVIPHFVPSGTGLARLATPFHAWPVQAVLAIAVLAIAAGPMLAGAARALVGRRANMDLLVSLGALTALTSGVAGGLAGAPEFILFDAAVLIVLFVGLGKHLEARTRGRASAAFAALLSRIPRTALRIADGRIEPVPIDAVQVGDRLRVPAHSTVPVDGEVLSGRAALDESLLTGESLPVARAPGDPVLGGTRAVEGLIEIRATATGSASAAARIAGLVAEAQASRPPWQRLADRLAAVFAPLVIGLALLTFVGWKLGGADTHWALLRTISTLVVACPCALGLAIPTAVLVGTTRAAEHGILVRSAAALEAAGHVREVLLDKTGTLTTGQPALAQMVILGGHNEREILRLAAGPERLSQHPLARAVVDAAEQRGIHVPSADTFQLEPGGGVRGTVGGTDVVVGSAAWLATHGVHVQPHGPAADELAATGASVVWVALDGRPAALLALSDALHPEARPAVTSLRQLGVRVRILSGDRRPAVQHVAGQLGIGTWEAELSPERKLHRVRELSGTGRIAMVGDGVNDAPALAAADVGIAIGTGADVAREAADICLVGHSPRLIAEAIRISRASARIMKQNLGWALAYNVVMLPVAVATPLPPWAATIAMMCSSISVVANALRLRRS